MTQNRYLGGLLPRIAFERLPAFSRGQTWQAAGPDVELRLQVGGSQWRCFSQGSLAILLRGYAIPRGSDQALDLARVAEEISDHYRDTGDLPVDRLEGSFTLVLMDGRRGRLLMHRNLVGNGNTYYTETAGGMLFASNLAELVDALGRTPAVNRTALPAYFLYRFVPGRETLFQGIYRLLPGEVVAADRRGLVRSQRLTVADLRESQPIGRDAIDRFEETASRVLADCQDSAPRTANLLSGGVDSSLLQALLNRQQTPEERRSFSIHVNHPHTRMDSVYAVTAAKALKTRHTLVPANEAYAHYLVDSLAATGEAPNHAQTVYFGVLGQKMAASGYPVGISGEGADSLFGLDMASEVQLARLVRTVLPYRPLRHWAAAAAQLARRRYLLGAIRMAEFIGNPGHPEHPVNVIGRLADVPAVRECFGSAAVTHAEAERRDLLRHYRVGADPLEQGHMLCFLADASHSAALWTGMLNRSGVDMLCPFFDSRMVRLAVNLETSQRFPFLRPKDLLKRSLARLASPELANRSKLGFGQPIFEWLAPGGQLRPLVERIGKYEFLTRKAHRHALANPNWFLYSLLCFDTWHKVFIEKSVQRLTTMPEIPGLQVA